MMRLLDLWFDLLPVGDFLELESTFEGLEGRDWEFTDVRLLAGLDTAVEGLGGREREFTDVRLLAGLETAVEGLECRERELPPLDVRLLPFEFLLFSLPMRTLCPRQCFWRSTLAAIAFSLPFFFNLLFKPLNVLRMKVGRLPSYFLFKM